MSEAKTKPLSREQLYELVWSTPMLRVGEQFGVSSSYMARVCTELRVPRPARGYWAKLEFGKDPSRPALPPARPGDILEWSPGDFIGSSERTAEKRPRRSLQTTPNELTPTSSNVPMRTGQAADSERVHPILAGIKANFVKTRSSRSGILRPYKRLMADLLVSEGRIAAGIASANALFLALTKRGHRVTIAPQGGQFKHAEVDLREVPRRNYYMQSAWTPPASPGGCPGCA